ncbi:MAG: RHS repeat-associated core domain-containing protein, partial [Actinomycetota bacterium]|nr:RHS repeat-associated core domain-containing protein [Actinomycetota bacterium]
PAGLAANISQRNVLRYAGYCYDEVSGLYYLSQRYYDPASACFVSKDPARADGEESAYQYCAGDPVGSVDPSGLVGSATRSGRWSGWTPVNVSNWFGGLGGFEFGARVDWGWTHGYAWAYVYYRTRRMWAGGGALVGAYPSVKVSVRVREPSGSRRWRRLGIRDLGKMTGGDKGENREYRNKSGSFHSIQYRSCWIERIRVSGTLRAIGGIQWPRRKQTRSIVVRNPFGSIRPGSRQR